ncbi:MAG TPA: DUF6526 family protein [Arachidicoccus sp.]|nr:DUF6526 family protein [Arachidicoccus sp.]
MKQNYDNHIRLYGPHHFIFLPLMSLLTLLGVYKAISSEDAALVWSLFAVLCGCILYLAIMVRQHYALGNQDRIVRLEFRLRYYELLGISAGGVENQLSFAQIAALRFASDPEFKALLARVLQEKLSGKDIKKLIKDWQPDYMRV